MGNDTDQRAEARRQWNWFKVVARSAILFGLLITVTSALVTGCSERLFFYPDRGEFETPDNAEDVYFENADGLTLHGWWIPPRGATPGERVPAVLHTHGNAFNIARHIELCEFLSNAGIGVFLFDYRSYGRSERGKLNRESVVADADAALDTLLARDDVDPDRVGMYGLSLGGAVALTLSPDRPELKAVAAVAPFSSWQDVASDHVPWIASLLIHDGTDPIEKIVDLGDRPLLLVHGEADSVVRPYHTERIEAAAREAGIDVERKTFPDLTHVDPAVVANGRAVITEFFVEHLGVEQPSLPATGAGSPTPTE
ncbi:MAG: alpha/beta fold hydrolase [Planctomycetota bacterium]